MWGSYRVSPNRTSGLERSSKTPTARSREKGSVERAMARNDGVVDPELPDRYETGERLSRGALGELWSARRVDLGKAVLVRVLSGAEAWDPERMALLHQRIRALAGLHAPALAAI